MEATGHPSKESSGYPPSSHFATLRPVPSSVPSDECTAEQSQLPRMQNTPQMLYFQNYIQLVRTPHMQWK